MNYHTNLFVRFYKASQLPNEPLEIKSVKRYLLNHNIKHIPVDTDPSQDLCTTDIEYMFAIFNKYDVYKKLDEEQNKMTEREGFDFLNSEKCIDLSEKKKITEKNLMEFMMNKNVLFRIHKLFYEEQDKREYEIIKNIYHYSKEDQYSKALLLIGLEHTKSILEKIEKYKAPENIKLNWRLYYNLNSL